MKLQNHCKIRASIGNSTYPLCLLVASLLIIVGELLFDDAEKRDKCFRPFSRISSVICIEQQQIHETGKQRLGRMTRKRFFLAISMTSLASFSGGIRAEKEPGPPYREERADARLKLFLRFSFTASLSRSFALGDAQRRKRCKSIELLQIL
ncbi:hypothetical protein GOODEAATRI_028324 [Goodea atripinnis]|uniref:Uncharacterized protein n=1 Tax=Goodea atripinnis TaxID=208336 RepID=A0ABV0NEA7_9TELE